MYLYFTYRNSKDFKIVTTYKRTCVAETRVQTKKKQVKKRKKITTLISAVAENEVASCAKQGQTLRRL
jgi:hypothetical protein